MSDLQQDAGFSLPQPKVSDPWPPAESRARVHGPDRFSRNPDLRAVDRIILFTKSLPVVLRLRNNDIINSHSRNLDLPEIEQPMVSYTLDLNKDFAATITWINKGSKSYPPR